MSPRRVRRATRGIGRVLAVAIALGCAACPEDRAIWLAPNASATNLVFVLGRTAGAPSPIGVSAFFVFACDTLTPPTHGKTMWSTYFHVRRSPEEATIRLAEIRYGETPVSHLVDVPAKQLVPGTYLASGAESVAFTINPAGRVSSRGSACPRGTAPANRRAARPNAGCSSRSRSG